MMAYPPHQMTRIATSGYSLAVSTSGPLTRLTRRACLAWSFAGLLWSASAHAQASDIDKGQAHFLAGRNYRAKGRCDLAVEEFSRAAEFDPMKVGPHLNLGDCYVELGRLPEAFRQFKEAERLAELLRDENRIANARKSAADVEAQMVRVLVLEDEPRVANVMMHVDGTPIGTSPWFIVVSPRAEHDITATAPDGRTWSAKAKGEAGDVVRLTVSLTPAPHEPQRPVATTPAPSHGVRTAAFIVGGVGALGLVTGAVSGALAISWRGELADAVQKDQRCTGTYPGACSPDARGALAPIEDRAYAAATLSTASIIAGAVLLASGGALYLLSRSGTKPSVQAKARTAGALLEGAF